MSKKLVVRINNIPDIETSDNYEVEEETVIRWDRVISVAIAGVLLLVALVFGICYFSSAEAPSTNISSTGIPSTNISSTSISSTNKPSSDASANDAPMFEAVSVPVEKSTDIESLSKDIDAGVIDKVQTIEINKAPVEVESSTVSIAEPSSSATPVVSAELNNSSQSANLVEPAQLTVVAETTKPAPMVAHEFVDPIDIKSSRIVKAQLTHGVAKSEPVDRLGNVVAMNGDKLIKVFLFTAIEGLKGETLYYDWYLSDKRMARVKVNVRSNKTSASSSKFIDQYMTGEWQVKVKTGGGDELVSAQFVVTQ